MTKRVLGCLSIVHLPLNLVQHQVVRLQTNGETPHGRVCLRYLQGVFPSWCLCYALPLAWKYLHVILQLYCISSYRRLLGCQGRGLVYELCIYSSFKQMELRTRGKGMFNPQCVSLRQICIFVSLVLPFNILIFLSK